MRKGGAKVKQKKQGSRQMRGFLLTAVAFLAMVLLLVFALSQVDSKSDSEQTKSLEDAVLRATLTCYAVEGRYPSSADYLTEYYGIVYNKDKYMIVLDAFAQNLLPDIRVLVKGGDVGI